jgi:hypothetical protein
MVKANNGQNIPAIFSRVRPMSQVLRRKREECRRCRSYDMVYRRGPELHLVFPIEAAWDYIRWSLAHLDRP